MEEGEVTLALQAEVCDRGKVNRGAPNGKNSRPAARIRERLDDFVVDEIPAYLPAGSGEHLYVRVEKRRLTTPEAVRALSEALGLDARGAGHAGMKDKHAVTTQWLSFHVPPSGRADALSRASGLVVEKAGGSVRVLEASWHANKLKPGHLAGNRFELVLRGLSADEEAAVIEALHEAGRGVPNYFGYQRFGAPSHAAASEGGPSSAERALAFVRGENRGPRDPHARRFAMSTAQSVLFDRVLSARHQAGTWRSVLPGDLAKRGDSGGLFRVPLEGDELADAVARGERGDVLPTGPMFGAKMTWPDGAPAELEREVLREAGVTPEHLAAVASLGEGTRRPLWMPVRDLRVEPGGATQVGPSGEAVRALAPDPAEALSVLADDAACERAGLAVSFTLPKGGYATTVLEAVCEVIDAARGPNRASPDIPAPEAE